MNFVSINCLITIGSISPKKSQTVLKRAGTDWEFCTISIIQFTSKRIAVDLKQASLFRQETGKVLSKLKT